MKKMNTCLVASLAALGFTTTCLATSAFADEVVTQQPATQVTQDVKADAPVPAPVAAPDVGPVDNCGLRGPMKDPKAFKQARAEYQAALHDKLQLNEQQEKKWQAYIETTQGKPFRAHMRNAPDKLTAPERLQLRLDNMKQHQAQTEKELAYLKVFYASLTPEQQKIFDTETAQHRFKHHPGHRMGGLRK